MSCVRNDSSLGLDVFVAIKQDLLLCKHFYSLFLAWPLLPTHCKCTGLLLHLITLNDTHTHTHTLGRTPLDKRSARCRNLYLTTKQHLQQTDSHAPGGIRTRNPKKRPVLWDRL